MSQETLRSQYTGQHTMQELRFAQTYLLVHSPQKEADGSSRDAGQQQQAPTEAWAAVHARAREQANDFRRRAQQVSVKELLQGGSTAVSVPSQGRPITTASRNGK